MWLPMIFVIFTATSPLTLIENNGLLNFRYCLNCPLSQTKDFKLINNICILSYSPDVLTV